MEWSIRYVCHNFAEPFTIGELARFVGLSKYHFSRKFRKETGLAPRAFVQRYRITRAMDLLVDSEHRIRDIAWRVGYKDHAAFSRAFNRITGTQPILYRLTRQSRRAEDRQGPPSSLPPPIS